MPSANLTFECDLILFKSFVQQRVFDFGVDAISRGQIGPSSFVETIVLVFLKNGNLLAGDDDISESVLGLIHS